jgi:thiol-disulfide isomerase/thioredoxin
MLRSCGLAVGLFTIALLGCRPAAGPPMPSAPTGGATLRVVDEKQFADALAEQRGKVVLVDFWATWCGPCRDLFPHTVELSRRYAGRGLTVMTVSLDDPDSEADVLHFLNAHQAPSANFLSRYGTSTKSIEAFQVGEGAIPYVKLYDQQGKLHKIFGMGGEDLSPARIEEAVKRLLGPSGV